MGIRNLRNAASRPAESLSITGWAAVLLAWLFAGGCGAPGEPTPPSPPIPVAVTDLAAHQAGDGVQLIFTLPSKTTTGDRLAASPAVEIVRGVPKANGSPDTKTQRVVYTIPGALVENYLTEGHVKFIDPVDPAETRAHPGGPLIYVVRTRAAKKRASTDSNAVLVRMFPVPEAIGHVEVRVTEPAIELSWTGPTHASGSAPITGFSGYRIYRGELDPASAEAAASDLSKAKWKVPLTLLAPADENSYRDSAFDFGKTYAYVVRSAVLVDGNPLESGDSTPAIVAPRDTFPPAAPQNVVGAVLAGATPDSLVVDLSWSINLETDLAGYRVYRSAQQGTRGTLVTPELLLAPAYRDTSVETGRRYWYSVTAVDRAGNESDASSAAAVDVAKLSP